VPEAGAERRPEDRALSLKDFITHLVPKSIFEAMANNEILQIVVFSVFFGTRPRRLIGDQAARSWSTRSKKRVHVMLKVTGYVMWWRRSRCSRPSPAHRHAGPRHPRGPIGKFMGEFYIASLLLWAVLIALGSS
jgi:hypothetical protein